MLFKKFESFKNYKFLAKETKNEINIFDIDDTIVLTRASIKVINHLDNSTIKLTPKEFNEYQKQDHHSLDFSEFNDLDILKGGKIINWVFEILKNTLKKSKAVGIITAREDSKLIYNFLIHNGVDINPEFIFAVGGNSGFTGNVSERKKQAFRELIRMGFTKFRFFDDDEQNLELAKSIEAEDPRIKIETKHVKQDWIPSHMNESVIIDLVNTQKNEFMNDIDLKQDFEDFKNSIFQKANLLINHLKEDEFIIKTFNNITPEEMDNILFICNKETQKLKFKRFKEKPTINSYKENIWKILATII